MNFKTEKRILAILVVVMGACLFMQYVIGLDNFEDPVLAKYWIEILLYPSGLVVLVLIWRQTLDKKIRTKTEREEDFQDATKDEQ